MILPSLRVWALVGRSVNRLAGDLSCQCCMVGVGPGREGVIAILAAVSQQTTLGEKVGPRRLPFQISEGRQAAGGSPRHNASGPHIRRHPRPVAITASRPWRVSSGAAPPPRGPRQPPPPRHTAGPPP